MNFKEGQILSMSPGYHTRNPYYVRVEYYNKEAKIGEIKMITSIPGEHECKMIVGSNWEYHRNRMEIVGEGKEFEYLLHNQQLT